MAWIIDRTLSFFVENLPSWRIIYAGGPIGLVWSYACLYLAGQLKTRRRWKTGYTRKVFHFLIFSSVAVIQWIWGTSAVCLFGGTCSLVIFYSIFRGEGNPLYEAMARESDEPHRTYYIVIPYFATLIGGLTSNILFGPVAVVGYLVTGFADAVGEPVGTRFGKHTYRVLSRTSVRAVRSWEGSAAVVIMSVVAMFMAVALTPELAISHVPWLFVPAFAVVCGLVEAITPRGWDNTTLQVVPSALVNGLL